MNRQTSNSTIEATDAALAAVRVASVCSQGANPLNRGVQAAQDGSDIGSDLCRNIFLAGRQAERFTGRPYINLVCLAHLIHRTSRPHFYYEYTINMFAHRRCWLDRVSDRIWEALKVDQVGFDRGTCPAAHVGRGISAPIKPRNKAASGRFAANDSLIRLAVSLIRTAIFNNRSRIVENSPLASACGLAMASRTVSISQ